VDGVRGDDDPSDDDSGLEGSSSGTGWCRCVGVRGGCVNPRDARCEWAVRATAERPSWWLSRSASATLSSKSKTSRNSRSMRPTSRLPKTPVQRAQCTFFSVESLRYWINGVRIDTRKTRLECSHLGRNNNCSEKDPLKCPFLEGDVEMWLGSVDVYQSSKDGGGRHFRPGDNVVHECGELGVFWSS
jgi:hypothetical protein